VPLIRIDAIAGRTPGDVQKLLDAAHRAMVAAFKVPERDRYQVYAEHPASHLIALDTGLNIPRTQKFVLFTVTTRPRSRAEKENFYKLLVQELWEHCAIATSDVMISLVQNSDEDWSFGNGRAQFLTGEL
jgi:hypothetical protein